MDSWSYTNVSLKIGNADSYLTTYSVLWSEYVSFDEGFVPLLWLLLVLYHVQISFIRSSLQFLPHIILLCFITTYSHLCFNLCISRYALNETPPFFKLSHIKFYCSVLYPSNFFLLHTTSSLRYSFERHFIVYAGITNYQFSLYC